MIHIVGIPAVSTLPFRTSNPLGPLGWKTPLKYQILLKQLEFRLTIAFQDSMSARHTASARCRTLWHGGSGKHLWSSTRPLGSISNNAGVDLSQRSFLQLQTLSISFCFGSQDTATLRRPKTRQVAVRRPCNTWATNWQLHCGFQRRTVLRWTSLQIICR